MKKLLLILTLCLVSISAFAQDKAKNETPDSKSKAVEFQRTEGSLIIKEFFDLPKIKGVECQVLILNNIVDGTKIGCLRLTTKYSSQYTNDTYIGTLDSDELSACIKSLQYIKDTLLPSNPSTYTEAEYKSNDGVLFGAFYNKKWNAYVYTKGYTSRSAEFLGIENIDSFISVMEQAKQLIAEKTK